MKLAFASALVAVVVGPWYKARSGSASRWWSYPCWRSSGRRHCRPSCSRSRCPAPRFMMAREWRFAEARGSRSPPWSGPNGQGALLTVAPACFSILPYSADSHRERWRDWPYETAATGGERAEVSSFVAHRKVPSPAGLDVQVLEDVGRARDGLFYGAGCATVEPETVEGGCIYSEHDTRPGCRS